MQNPPPSQPGSSSSGIGGLDPKVAAALSYIWIVGLIFFFIEKENRFVRFHAMQSLLFDILVGVAVFVLWIVLFVFFLILSQISGVLSTIASLVSVLIWVVLSIAILVGWVMCLIKAYQSQYFKLPIIGNFAEKFSAK